MDKVKNIFANIEELIKEEGQNEVVLMLCKSITNTSKHENKESSFITIQLFLLKIIKEIDELATEIRNDNKILISVKNQKLLRTCYQLITSLGFSISLLPGLGINLAKRCSSAALLPEITLSDEEKYEVLVFCTDFFTRSYSIPVLKNIIISFHLSDYLAALIQLSFAPLKKPGHYANFIMTKELYEKLNLVKEKYKQVYEYLVSNCFQPILMKELLVLQSGKDPAPPNFVKRIIAKEMSKRLLVSGGLLSLIRCFIESYNVDTAYEWKKIDMICKIVSAKHGDGTEEEYLSNICSQLMQVLHLNNTHYLATAVACVLSLSDTYTQSTHVTVLVNEMFQEFDYNYLVSKSSLPGTILLSPQELDRKVNVLHACICRVKLEWDIKKFLPNFYTVFLLGLKCSNNQDMKSKLTDIILKYLEQLNKEDILRTMTMCLFGVDVKSTDIVVEEYEAGLAVKCVAASIPYPKEEALIYFINLIKASTECKLVQNIFEVSLQILINITNARTNRNSRETLLHVEDEPEIVDSNDEKYAVILQFLSEISTMPKVITSLKTDPSTVLNFIEYFILKNKSNSNEECTTIALVLLNTILENQNRSQNSKLGHLVPYLKKIAVDEFSINNMLCKEALTLIASENPQKIESACGKAIAKVFDELLPVRAHGIMELTKLVDSKEPEAISKKHYIFCLFQQQLKDVDSYVYLAAINGIASLGTHCTEDVLHILCKEFLQISSDQNDLPTKDSENTISEVRMKVGDIIVKVTKQLGEMAILHKTILLNTMLCGCRDEDPLIRTSALSNLAEIALVLHYKIGSIIYEVLLCIWGTIESDQAVECRRAAVMVLSSLLKGLGKETLVQLKENLLPIYRTLKNLYTNPLEDSVVKLHAQIALEELNDIVVDFLFPEVKMEKQIFVLDQPNGPLFK